MGILAPFFISSGVAFVITVLVVRFAKPLGVLDDPNKRSHPARLHIHPIPRGGGIGILVSLFISTLLFLALNLQIVALLAASALIVGVGILDDRKDIAPFIRLTVQTIAAALIVASGITITYITNPFGGIFTFSSLTLLGIPMATWTITVVWLVFITNTVSWSSGVDGQLAGFVPIAAATIGALSLRFAQDASQTIIILSAIVAGAYLGFLPLSSYPQKIMPGFSGGTLAGFLLGVLSILAVSKMATAAIVLGIPVMDAVFTITRRLAQGKLPWRGDQGHLHHRLLAAGWSKRKIALFYSFAASVLGFFALHLNSQAKFYTIIMLAVLVGALIVWLTFGKLLKQRGQPIG